VCLCVERSLHAPFIASRRYRVTRHWCVGDPCRGSSPEASGGLIRWRHGLHCRGMALVLLVLLLHGVAGVPLLREWFLSFGTVVVCPVIPVLWPAWHFGPCGLTWHGGPRPRGWGMWHDLALIVGIVVRIAVMYSVHARIVRIVPSWVA
jgi:hypothetical protein